MIKMIDYYYFFISRDLIIINCLFIIIKKIQNPRVLDCKIVTMRKISDNFRIPGRRNCDVENFCSVILRIDLRRKGVAFTA